MTDGNRAAVGIPLFKIYLFTGLFFQLNRHGQVLNGEGFIAFHDVHLAHLQAGTLQYKWRLKGVVEGAVKFTRLNFFVPVPPG